MKTIGKWLNLYQQTHPDLRWKLLRRPTIPLNSTSLWLMRRIEARKRYEEQSDINHQLFWLQREDRSRFAVRVFKPRWSTMPLPALLWFHGGGFVHGSPLNDLAFILDMVRSLNIAMICPHYALAPERPFPAALNDGQASLAWLFQEAQTLDVDPSRIGVGGLSAGGNLAAAVAQQALHTYSPRLSCQLLNAPMLDWQTHLRRQRLCVYWTCSKNAFGWQCYAASPVRDLPRYLSPVYEEELGGLPPTWIGVGELDLFFEEDQQYAVKLAEAGVQSELYAVPGAFHSFDGMVPKAAISQHFKQAQKHFLAKYLNTHGLQGR